MVIIVGRVSSLNASGVMLSASVVAGHGALLSEWNCEMYMSPPILVKLYQVWWHEKGPAGNYYM